MQEQPDVAAFAENGNTDHHSQRQQRLRSVRYGLSDRAHISRNSLPCCAIQTLCHVNMNTRRPKLPR